MEKGKDTAAALIDSTVRIVALHGLDKASVRSISSDCRIPNPYIYHFFKDKDDLLHASFSKVDTALTAELSHSISSAHCQWNDTESRCRAIWLQLWDYMMEHQEPIQFYVRYHYSTYYEQYSVAGHRARLHPLAEAIHESFKEDTNVEVLLQVMLDCMMNLAMKVYCGELPDNSQARHQYYTLTMAAVTPYFRAMNSRAGLRKLLGAAAGGTAQS